MNYRQAARAARTADAVAAPLPADFLAPDIHAEVIAALSRWHHLDPHSLQDLAGALVTSDGTFVGDSSGYLSALHGFVAEQYVAEHFAQATTMVLPDTTNVPAIDLYVNGVPYQVKEGTYAYEQAQIALQRYPDITHFVTDPLTAARLKAEGIDAVGLASLAPERIAEDTMGSIDGLSALERVGHVHVPVLTTLFSICRYWEAYDSEGLDAATAIGRGAVDIGAQALGAAVGAKIAAVAIVATGAFSIAALPLTAGALAGAFGLRALVQQRRGKPLREALLELDRVRELAEAAGEIVVTLSRDAAQTTASSIWRALRRENALGEQQRREARTAAFAETSRDAQRLASSLLDDPDLGAEDRRAAALRFASAASVTDDEKRCKELILAIEVLAALSPATSLVRRRVAALNLRTLRRFNRLTHTEEDAHRHWADALARAKRELLVDLSGQYLVLVEQLARIAAPVSRALERVECESDRLHAARLPTC